MYGNSTTEAYIVYVGKPGVITITGWVSLVVLTMGQPLHIVIPAPNVITEPVY